METQTRPPPLTTARLNISLLRANCCGGILSTSHHKRLDTGLAEDTWTDLCLWSQLNTSLLCPSWKNMLPPSLIVSVYIFYSLSLLLCPTSLPPSLSLQAIISIPRFVSGCSGESSLLKGKVEPLIDLLWCPSPTSPSPWSHHFHFLSLTQTMTHLTPNV